MQSISRVTPTSEYEDVQAAVDHAGRGDVVLVDSNHTISSSIRVGSNVSIKGGGGRLTLAAGSNADALRLEGARNVTIRDLHIDGNESEQDSGLALIGGRSLHDVENLRVTNCRLMNAPGNAITLHVDQPQDTLRDIYIGGNYIENARRHGILVGASPAGEVTDLVVQNNRVTNWGHAQAVGAFCQKDGDTHGVALVGNRITHDGEGSDNNVATLVFEERVRDSVMYGNVVDCPSLRGNGPIVTKDARGNLVAGNVCNVGKAGLGCVNFRYYEPEGPPVGNVFTHNSVSDSKAGVRIKNTDGRNAYWRNAFHDCPKNVQLIDSDQAAGPRYLAENGPTVPEDVTDGGESPVSYSTADGSVTAEASWQGWSARTDDPVSVTVSTTVPREN